MYLMHRLLINSTLVLVVPNIFSIITFIYRVAVDVYHNIGARHRNITHEQQK